jgi:hypothetical protein
MNANSETADVTLKLPRSVYETAMELARATAQPITDLLSSVVTDGLAIPDSPREGFERVSASYRARPAREGKLDQSPEEVLQELRELREQVVRDLYP